MKSLMKRIAENVVLSAAVLAVGLPISLWFDGIQGVKFEPGVGTAGLVMHHAQLLMWGIAVGSIMRR